MGLRTGRPFNELGKHAGQTLVAGEFEPQYGGRRRPQRAWQCVRATGEGFDLWNDATTTIEDRIDAVIAHEWSESSIDSRIGETVELVPETKLAISPRARELNQYMKMKAGNYERAVTEFTKAEWNAIKAAGKEEAPFEEKMAAAVAAKAK